MECPHHRERFRRHILHLVLGSVKPTAFLSRDQNLVVVHVVNNEDAEIPIALKLSGALGKQTTAKRSRTSATEDAKPMDDLTAARGFFSDKLPARSMVTYRIGHDG